MLEYTQHKPDGYTPRLTDALVQQQLARFGAVEICGPRWCGKSWTAAAFAESIVRVDEDAALYAADPALALIGAQPHVIDEWQDAPAIWNLVRHDIDDHAASKGRYLLTGSSAPPQQEARHSGAGRIGRLRMSTMTLTETGESSATVSLQGLFEGSFSPQEARLDLQDLAAIICRGGWPALQNGVSPADSAAIIDEYLDVLFGITMRRAGKNPILARRIALAVARNLGTSATLRTLAADAAAGESDAPTERTVSEYLSDFALNYMLYELPGWDAPVKARSRVRTKPKRYFADPSLAASLLATTPDRIIREGQLLGILFESLCIHDLAVYVDMLPDSSPQSLRYYADAEGLEVDAVIELRDGRWAAFEVKLGEAKEEEAAVSLHRLRKKVSANPATRNPEPEFMAILVGKGAYARQRKQDGIYVIPLGTLTA